MAEIIRELDRVVETGLDLSRFLNLIAPLGKDIAQARQSGETGLCSIFFIQVCVFGCSRPCMSHGGILRVSGNFGRKDLGDWLSDPVLADVVKFITEISAETASPLVQGKTAEAPTWPWPWRTCCPSSEPPLRGARAGAATATAGNAKGVILACVVPAIAREDAPGPVVRAILPQGPHAPPRAARRL